MTNDIHAAATPRKCRIYTIKTFRDRDDWMERLLQIKASELSGAAKLVAVCIALHLDLETRRCDRSSELIADELGMDGRSVRRMIRKLEDAGWIDVDRTLGFYGIKPLRLVVTDQLLDLRSACAANGLPRGQHI
jgi:hypothetical protein